MQILSLLLLLLTSCTNNSHRSDNWIGEPNSGFRNLKSVTTQHYSISSGHQLASEAGAEIMKQGGNAVDAAIAAQLVLNVVEPHSSGIGGGGFFLYFDAKTKQTIFFDGRETAPRKVKPDMFLDQNGKPKKFSDAVKGGLSVGTPGILKALKAAHQSYGKLPWKKLFTPAIRIANDGFPVSKRLNLLAHKIDYLKDSQEAAEIYLNASKKPKAVGAIIKNPKLAETFTIIAEQGIKPFYQGKIANDIVTTVQQSKNNPGYLTLSDLKNYRSKQGKLICLKYRAQYNVCSMPSPSGGVTLLQILGILENFDLKNFKPNSVETVHLISEATKLAYADRNQYVADIANVPLKQMLNKKYLKKRAALIDIQHALTNINAGKFTKQNYAKNSANAEPPSTTHLSIIDREGNAVSLTSSIEYFFGSALSVDGFLLNNQLTDFSFEPKKEGKVVANRIAPGKRPRSSMSPTFVFDEKNNLILTIGSPGGPRIIQFVAKTIIYHLDFGLDIQQAISAPNFIALNNVIELEEKTPLTKLSSQLQKLGHNTKIIPITSGLNAIAINNNENKKTLIGGTDPRREGEVNGI